MITHEEISKRARAIWEREGRPEGRDKDHWLQAETELQSETQRHPSIRNTPTLEDNLVQVAGGDPKENGFRKRGPVRRGK